MSWNAEDIKESRTSKKLGVTSFFGGENRGRCLQLTQWRDHDETGNGEQVMHVSLNEAQMEELVQRFNDWKSGKISEHDPHGKHANGVW